MNQRSLIGVVAALPEEIRPLQNRLQKAIKAPLNPGKALQGDLGSHRIVTLATGDGSERAGRGLDRLLAALEIDAVIAIGIAGGLSDDLEVGDVVIANRVTNGSGEVPEPDGELLALGSQLQGVRLGSIYSHSEIAIDPVSKERLWQQEGGQASQVVDLESASFARVAAARHVPWLAIRAVSDSSDEALPLDFNRFRRADGSSDRIGVGRYAVRHPSILPELMQLRARLRHCAESLANLVEEMLNR